jgi:hypothetical protein
MKVLDRWMVGGQVAMQSDLRFNLKLRRSTEDGASGWTLKVRRLHLRIVDRVRSVFVLHFFLYPVIIIGKEALLTSAWKAMVFYPN